MKLNYKVKADATGDQTVKINYANGAINATEGVSIAELKTFTFTVEVPEPDVTWSDWQERTAATCDKAGLEFRTSSKGVEETREIPALGHKWGDPKPITAATCLTKGTAERVCLTDPTHKETIEVAALGHDWGAWTPVKAANCTEKGSEERVCKRDAAHKETREVAALGHDWGAWKVVKEATCTVKGVEERICKRDATHKETKEIALLAHKEGKWEVVRKATADEPGLRVIKCLVGGEILKQEEIPFSTVRRFTNNTVSSQGFYFRDEVKGLTKEWNMFTPIDISAEGEQTFPLIASNMYYIGNVKVAVAGGNVTVTYEYANGVKDKKQFLAILPDLASVKSILPNQLGDYAKNYGEPISIENDLKGDTKVLLYVRNTVDYADNYKGVTRFTNRLDAYTKVLDGLRALMD